MAPRRLVIAGAGIGGLTAALALSARGIASLVIERAPELTEVGAGIQLAANATRVLAKLGLLDAVAAHATTPDALEVYSVLSGASPLVAMPIARSFEKKFGAPYLVLHRADLQRVLLKAVQADPRIELRLDSRVTGVSATSAGVSVTVETGAVTARLEGDALIGADGVRSVVRTGALDGASAHYSGRTAYRATIPAGETPDSMRTVTGLWMAEKTHLVHYPVRAGSEINLIVVVQDAWTGEGWAEPVDRAEVLARFRDWPDPIPSVIAAPAVWVKWALCGINPDFRWSRGRITLLGDACHPTLPFLAQGAAMAIEDAYVLADEVARRPTDLPAAFLAYEDRRKQRVIRIVREGRENGIVYHLGGAAAFARDMGLKLLGPDRLADRYKWLWSWSPDERRRRWWFGG